MSAKKGSYSHSSSSWLTNRRFSYSSSSKYRQKGKNKWTAISHAFGWDDNLFCCEVQILGCKHEGEYGLKRHKWQSLIMLHLGQAPLLVLINCIRSQNTYLGLVSSFKYPLKHQRQSLGLQSHRQLLLHQSNPTVLDHYWIAQKVLLQVWGK